MICKKCRNSGTVKIKNRAGKVVREVACSCPAGARSTPPKPQKPKSQPPADAWWLRD